MPQSFGEPIIIIKYQRRRNYKETLMTRPCATLERRKTGAFHSILTTSDDLSSTPHFHTNEECLYQATKKKPLWCTIDMPPLTTGENYQELKKASPFLKQGATVRAIST